MGEWDAAADGMANEGDDPREGRGVGASEPFPPAVEQLAAMLMTVPDQMPSLRRVGVLTPSRPKQLDRWLVKARRRRSRSLSEPSRGQLSAEVRQEFAQFGLDLTHPGVALVAGLTSRILEGRPRSAVAIVGDLAAEVVSGELGADEGVADALARFGIVPIEEPCRQLRLL